MLNKENNIIFLQAIQEKQFNKAYKIGSQILNKNPNEQSIKRFMIFLLQYIYLIFVNYQSEEEDDEEEQDEYDYEIELYQKRQKKYKKAQPIKVNKPERNHEIKNIYDMRNKQIEMPVKTKKQIQQIRNLKQTNKMSNKQLNKPSDVQQIKTIVPQISIQFPSLVRK
ncbi:unnamed protein product [Paramecium octaurelia]|uniref:Uncharacterized protein n=1 Tax=Paramecium octaurelia TaxID=43137 RepID=A0A8S1UIT5_PAROT|nr:unnamed protein product [Paramecium octaurelia]